MTWLTAALNSLPVGAPGRVGEHINNRSFIKNTDISLRLHWLEINQRHQAQAMRILWAVGIPVLYPIYKSLICWQPTQLLKVLKRRLDLLRPRTHWLRPIIRKSVENCSKAQQGLARVKANLSSLSLQKVSLVRHWTEEGLNFILSGITGRNQEGFDAVHQHVDPYEGSKY